MNSIFNISSPCSFVCVIFCTVCLTFRNLQAAVGAYCDYCGNNTVIHLPEVNVVDETPIFLVAANTGFQKTWRLKNSGGSFKLFTPYTHTHTGSFKLCTPQAHIQGTHTHAHSHTHTRTHTHTHTHTHTYIHTHSHTHTHAYMYRS